MIVMQHLIDTLRAAATYNEAVQAPPAAILWPDKESQWLSAIDDIQAAMPELLVIGSYDQDKRCGPAIWLKCMIARALPEPVIPEGYTPIIYLPGIGRSDLATIETLPADLMPLAELQFRGTVWKQPNGTDWTVLAVLVSNQGGLGLNVAKDNSTKQAMLAALPELLQSQVSSLRERILEASDFNQLLSGDINQDILVWLNKGPTIRSHWKEPRWQAFVHRCKSELQFDPDKEGNLVAAERMCARGGKWDAVWQRYEESWRVYPSIYKVLARVEPPDNLFQTQYLSYNLREEEELAKRLNELLALSAHEVRQGVIALESRHGLRRNTLWEQQGLVPLATLLKPASQLAQHTAANYGGLVPEDMVIAYTREYWQADAALMQALAMAKNLPPAQAVMVRELIGKIYTPWVEKSALTFQKLIKERSYTPPEINEATVQYQIGGEVIFFIDGLRFDVAQQLKKLLEDRELQVTLGYNWAALPTVTATAKAAVTPVHAKLSGKDSDKEFQPSLKDDDKPFTMHYFRKLMAAEGWQALANDETGDPSGKAWVECGNIDEEGHQQGWKLACRIEALLKDIVDRISELFAGGWQRIRIVTDHGWLLIPNGLPKVHLPSHATETRWGRCAVLKDNVSLDVMTMGWHWNPKVSIAFAPGISSFIAGHEYDHGGISLQECITPVLNITNTTNSLTLTRASIQSVTWRGLTCVVEAHSEGGDVLVDLRRKPADSASTLLATTKSLHNNKCSLMVPDDDNEGQPAVIVIADKAGNVLAKKATIVGGDE